MIVEYLCPYSLQDTLGGHQSSAMVPSAHASSVPTSLLSSSGDLTPHLSTPEIPVVQDAHPETGLLTSLFSGLTMGNDGVWR